MSRTMWILLALIAALSVATMWRDSQKLPAPSYTLCKESLAKQMLTGKCELRTKVETTDY